MTLVKFSVVDALGLPKEGVLVRFNLAPDWTWNAEGEKLQVASHQTTSDETGLVQLDLPAQISWAGDTSYQVTVGGYNIGHIFVPAVAGPLELHSLLVPPPEVPQGG